MLSAPFLSKVILKHDLIFLQFVAQSTFSASQGVRDIDLLSWTTLSCFPQVSCQKEGQMYMALLLLCFPPVFVFIFVCSKPC